MRVCNQVSKKRLLRNLPFTFVLSLKILVRLLELVHVVEALLLVPVSVVLWRRLLPHVQMVLVAEL